MPYRLAVYILFYSVTRPATAGSSIGNSTIWRNIDFVRPRSSLHVGFSKSRNNSIIHPSTLWRHINRRRMRMMMCCPQPQQEQQQVVMDTLQQQKATPHVVSKRWFIHNKKDTPTILRHNCGGRGVLGHKTVALSLLPDDSRDSFILNQPPSHFLWF